MIQTCGYNIGRGGANMGSRGRANHAYREKVCSLGFHRRAKFLELNFFMREAFL